jgi:outer membrane protein TolC
MKIGLFMKKFLSFLIIYFLAYNQAFSENSYITWAECVQLTLKNNPDIMSAKEKLEQARAAKGMTRGSVLPSINANASYGHRIAGTNNTGNPDSYSYSASARQLLFDGLKSVYDLKRADIQISSAEMSYLSKEIDTIYNARCCFIDLMKAENYISITEEIYKRRMANYNLVKMRYNAGRENKGSLLSSEADILNSKNSMENAKLNLELSKKALCTTMGFPKFEKSFTVALNFSTNIDTGMQPDFSYIAENNPILRQMVLNTESAEYAHKSSISEFFPKIYAGLNASANGDSPRPTNKNLSVGLEASIPIFQGGSRYYAEKKTESEYRQARIEQGGTKNSILLTVERAWVNLQIKSQNLTVQETYLKAAQERSKIAESQYSIGLISFNEWNIIEESMVNSINSHLNAKADLLYAEAIWVQATGGIGKYEK